MASSPFDGDESYDSRRNRRSRKIGAHEVGMGNGINQVTLLEGNLPPMSSIKRHGETPGEERTIA